VRRQVGRVVAAVVAAGALATGCGGPNQAGSAVIVGSEAVPLEAVQAQLDTALAKPEQLAQLEAQGNGPDDIARGIVTQRVLHDLVTREAAARGITVTDQQVESALADSGGADAVLESSFYDPQTLRERVRDDLLAAELARREVGGLSVTADLVAATSEREATETAEKLAAGGPAAEALFTNPETAARGQTYQAVTSPDAAGSVLFGTPVGGVVSFRPNPQQATWIVFRVTDRRTDVQSPPEAVDSLSQTDLITIGQRLLQPVAAEVGVRVNPRYGVWDPIRMQVVAEDERAGRVLLPAAPPAG
jgi:hypothetical protein